jgi:hypothetical protein
VAVRKAFTAAILVLSLLHHGLVMAGSGFIYHTGEGIAHAVMHWQDAGHHHHDDGSVHEDHSDDESGSHVQADGALGAFALPAADPVLGFHGFDSAAVPTLIQARAAPFLEGPTRPPRLTA